MTFLRRAASLPIWDCAGSRRTSGYAEHDREKYKWRHLVENFFCSIKAFRRIATRYEKTDKCFAAIISLVATVLWTRSTREKTKLLNRVRRVREQVEAIERALEQEIDCAHVLHLVAVVRGAVNALIGEVIEDRIRIQNDGTPQPADAAQELIDVLKSYLKSCLSG
jgi:DNA-binding FrmR family transcriptional regulator